jgi:voltage-gated potassium channel
MLRLLVYYSVITYLIELSLGSSNSLEGVPFFLWSERAVAVIFTFEYVLRILKSNVDYIGKHTVDYEGTECLKAVWRYVKSPLGIVDLISIVPFWAGFFVPAAWLGPVRAMRILRLLKCFRYNESLQLVARGFKRAWPMCRALAFATGMFWIFSSVVIFELEKVAQPEAFTLYKSFWFTSVTMTTVGYGDMSPSTPIGQMFSMVMFIVALALYSGVLGTIASSLAEEVKETSDAKLDIAA